MKKILLSIISFFVVFQLVAQAPEKFNYQAIIRNSSGEAVKDQQISLKFEIIKISNETTVYTETHSLTTNSFGLINTQIGTGESSNSFSDIDWAQDDYKVQVSFDSEGTGSYTTMGSEQLLSVPYALYAATSGDKQTLSINGNIISLSDGGSITLPADQTDDADADATNEIQDLELSGSILKITNNENATEIDLTPFTGANTDEQNLDLTGTTLSIDNGNSVDLSVLQDGVDDADANPMNEIQTLTIKDDTIFLSAGGFVELPNSFSGDYNDLTNTPDLSNYDNDKTDDFSGDYNDLTNKPTLSGDVTGNLDNVNVEKIQGMNISAISPADGQILKWNNTTLAWEPSEDQLGAAGTTDGVVTSIAIAGIASKTITLNRSNSLPAITATFDDEVDDADADASNEIQDLSISGTTLSLSDDPTTVDLSILQDGTGTDDQTLSLSGNTLSIEDGNSVDLSSLQDGYEANTDAQTLSLSGTNLSISNGNTINVSSLQDGTGTDDQTISLSSNTLSIESGNSVDLSAYLDNTDEQDLSISGTTLSLTGDDTSVDLSILQDGTGTDDQILSLSGNTLSIEDGNSVDLSTLQDGTGTDDQTIDYIALYENKLQISLEGDNESVKELDLSSFLDNTDNQTIDKIAMSGNYLTLSLSGDQELDKYVDLSQFNDNTDNQTIDDFRLSGYTLYLSLEDDGEASQYVNLSSLRDGINTDDQTLSEILAVNTSAGSKKITDLATPTAANDAATKDYVDSHYPQLFASPDEHTYGYAVNGSIYFTTDLNARVILNDTRIQTAYANNNLFMGNNAGSTITVGSASGNTSFGDYTLDGVTTGDYNTAVGLYSGSTISTGSNNTTYGYKSGYTGDGSYNTFIGTLAGEVLSGNENVVVGYYAGRAASGGSGQDNTFLGSFAGYYGLGSYNLFAGYKSGYQNNSDYNVFLGYQAGYSNDGDGSVFIGKNAGYYETGSDKLYITNQMGTSEANGRTSALLYGDFSAKTLDINGTLNINQAYTLPTSDGSDGQVLSTDGSGTLSWADSKTYVTNLSDPATTNDSRSNSTTISYTVQDMIKGGYTSLNQGFYKHGDSETIIELESISWVEFTNYDNTGDIIITMIVAGTTANFGTKTVVIPASKIDDTSDLIRVHFKSYWTSLTSGTKYVKYTIKCDSGSDADAVITIHKVGYESSVVAKEYSATSYSQ